MVILATIMAGQLLLSLSLRGVPSEIPPGLGTAPSPRLAATALRQPPLANTPQPPSRQELLEQLVSEFSAAQPADFYIYIEDLQTGDKAALGANKPIPSGSIYKLFLANEVYRRSAAGKLDVNAPAGGSGYSIAGCTMQMIQNSLNLCGEAMRELLGAAETTKALHKQGYTNTDLKKDPAAETSAADVALLLKRLYRGNYFTRGQTTEFLGYLRNQRYRFRLPEGLPLEPARQGLIGTRNKTGDVLAYTNDAAIILGENTDYIIVSLSGPWKLPFAESSKAHRHLSGIVYNFLNGTDYKLKY